MQAQANNLNTKSLTQADLVKSAYEAKVKQQAKTKAETTPIDEPPNLNYTEDIVRNAYEAKFNKEQEQTGVSEEASGEKTIAMVARVKIDNWKFTPNDGLYLKYKDVYDNPKFFNQTTGDAIFPGMNGDFNLNGFANGKYNMETLQPGKIIDRYGSNGTGKFFSLSGTSYGKRALPPFMENELYTQYRILQPVEVKSGKIAPWFSQSGNGTQFLLDYSVDELIKMGIIEKVK